MISREEKSKPIVDKMEKEKKREKQHRYLFRVFLIFFFLTFFVVGFFCYMRFIATNGLVVREYKVVDGMLPTSFHGFKIVHFSDLHYQSTFDYNDLKHLVNEINRLKPDVVVFTGDLTDQDTLIQEEDIEALKEQLNQIEATTGLYAVRGNHDYANNTFDLVFQNTSFKILDNNYDLIYSHGTTPILITGIGSMLQNDDDIVQAFNYIDSESLYTISLFHEPDMIDKVKNYNHVNLALSGHSHNGQVVIPKIGAVLRVDGAKKYPNSYYQVGDTKLYVSGGLGTSLYKLRLFNRPSINLYRLVEE